MLDKFIRGGAMLRRSALMLGAGLALVSQPAAAQDEMADEDIFGALSAMMETEPLTAEQQERLPLAETIVAKIVPDGTMAEMGAGIFDGILGSLIGGSTEPTVSSVAEELGIESYGIEMSDLEVKEALAILDPAWQQRKNVEAELMPKMFAEVMGAMEPGMRKAMAELYAINFTEQELRDIDAFFSTESGTNFARKSYSMATDPRIVAASMEALPAIMASAMTMEQQMAEATADLPAKRSFAELGKKERMRIAELTGYSVEEIEASIEATAAVEETWEDAYAEDAAEAAADAVAEAAEAAAEDVAE
ncbi:MAG: DUF2059 domain-containing protein [Sphingomonadaceae bacterium]|nr:DUF2059 domain-containing protein [Sphingomonadaceae bacterium]